MENYKNVKGYICDAECNSPKAEFIREYESLFMAEDLEPVLSVLDGNIVWEMVGIVTVEGIDEVRKLFSHPPVGEGEMEMIEMRVDGILTEGLWGCSFGTSIMSNGDTFAFNDVIRFKDSEEIIIEKVKSFIVKLE